MKTLFVSIALFLYADGYFITTASRSTKEKPVLSVEDLIGLRKESPQSIGNRLTQLSWINTTEENIEKENIGKDEASWKSGKKEAEDEYLCYSPAAKIKSKYKGPSILYIVSTESGYLGLIRQAKEKKLIRCKDAEHDVHKDDKELHYYNEDYNIIFSQNNDWGILFSGAVEIFGEKK